MRFTGGSELAATGWVDTLTGVSVQIAELLHEIVFERCEPIVGVIDHLTADFALAPLPIGASCHNGVVVRGRVPDVSETVRFLPEHCMM